MFLLIIVLSILSFFKTISYGLFEIKKNSNLYGGICLIAISFITLIFPTIMVYIRGSN